MARQDDHIRITLRLPADLHRRLMEVAGVQSLNAEIITRLERAFEYETTVDDLWKKVERLEELVRDHDNIIHRRDPDPR